jgi:hypothetical protein
MLAYQLLSRDCGRMAVRFVRLALKVAMQNDGDFVGVILLYVSRCWFVWIACCSIRYLAMCVAQNFRSVTFVFFIINKPSDCFIP